MATCVTTPGKIHHQLLTIHPTMPPAPKRAEADMPIVAARIALGVPESDIIMLGTRVIKPRPRPVTRMPLRERIVLIQAALVLYNGDEVVNGCSDTVDCARVGLDTEFQYVNRVVDNGVPPTLPLSDVNFVTPKYVMIC